MRPRNKAFLSVGREQKTVNYIESRLNKSLSFVNEAKKAHNSDDEYLNFLLHALNAAEAACLSMNAIIHERYSADGTVSELKSEYGLADMPVHISLEEHALRVFMPYTFPRGSSKAVVLANYLSNEFYSFKRSHPEINLTTVFTPPIIAIVKRKCKASTARRLQDNDNYEISRFINVIASEIGGTDNNTSLLFAQTYSTLSIEDNEDKFGIEILVCEKKEFPSFVEEL